MMFSYSAKKKRYFHRHSTTGRRTSLSCIASVLLECEPLLKRVVYNVDIFPMAKNWSRLFPAKRLNFFFLFIYSSFSLFDQMSRRKDKHPKRAENVRTVVVSSAAEEREERVLCLKIPDEDEVVFEIEQKEIRKEKTTTKRGKRKWTQRHECDVCEKMFGSQADLARHMRIHTNERPYECEVCEKRFTRADHLQTHMRIHTNEKPYECDVCDKAFRDSSNLKKHKRTHTNERPYECHVCEKRFTRAYNLTVHKRIHTNEKPYECDVCEKRFRQSSTLKRHMRTQH